MFDSCPDMLRVEDVCKLLLISRNSLYILLKSGELKGFQSGRMWRIPRQALVEYVKKKRTEVMQRPLPSGRGQRFLKGLRPSMFLAMPVGIYPRHAWLYYVFEKLWFSSSFPKFVCS